VLYLSLVEAYEETGVVVADVCGGSVIDVPVAVPRGRRRGQVTGVVAASVAARH